MVSHQPQIQHSLRHGPEILPNEANTFWALHSYVFSYSQDSSNVELPEDISLNYKLGWNRTPRKTLDLAGHADGTRIRGGDQPVEIPNHVCGGRRRNAPRQHSGRRHNSSISAAPAASSSLRNLLTVAPVCDGSSSTVVTVKVSMLHMTCWNPWSESASRKSRFWCLKQTFRDCFKTKKWF